MATIVVEAYSVPLTTVAIAIVKFVQVYCAHVMRNCPGMDATNLNTALGQVMTWCH